MSDINFSFNYNGTTVTMLDRLKGVEQKMRQQYADKLQSVDVVWKDSGCEANFTVTGFSIKVILELTPNAAAPDDGGTGTVTVVLPMVLGMFKGAIESRIRSEVDKLIGK